MLCDCEALAELIFFATYNLFMKPSDHHQAKLANFCTLTARRLNTEGDAQYISDSLTARVVCFLTFNQLIN